MKITGFFQTKNSARRVTFFYIVANLCHAWVENTAFHLSQCVVVKTTGKSADSGNGAPPKLNQ